MQKTYYPSEELKSLQIRHSARLNKAALIATAAHHRFRWQDYFSSGVRGTKRAVGLPVESELKSANIQQARADKARHVAALLSPDGAAYGEALKALPGLAHYLAEIRSDGEIVLQYGSGPVAVPRTWLAALTVGRNTGTCRINIPVEKWGLSEFYTPVEKVGVGHYGTGSMPDRERPGGSLWLAAGSAPSRGADGLSERLKEIDGKMMSILREYDSPTPQLSAKDRHHIRGLEHMYTRLQQQFALSGERHMARLSTFASANSRGKAASEKISSEGGTPRVRPARL